MFNYSIVFLLILKMSACTHSNQQTPGSCESKVRSQIRRILATNLEFSQGLPYNAFVYINPRAIEQARRLDQSEQHNSVQCMTVVIKDNIDTYDMPSSSGTLALLGSQSAQDALLVANLRQSGAIIIGKSSMDELVSGISGIASRHGRTGNAYDNRESPGGSSAGSGVAVALGCADLGIGTDNSGSVRIPAVFNGLVGLRPTKGLLSEKGIFPRGHIDGVPGPMAITATSVAQAMDAMLGSKGQFIET